MIFSWNIRAWSELVYPPLLKKARQLAYVKVLLAPLQTTFDSFAAYRVATLKKMRYNGQTIILENLLNDMFDSTDRGIRIITTYDISLPNYIFLSTESNPLYVFKSTENQPLYVANSFEYGVNYDFIVRVPLGILTADQEVRLKAITTYYKLAGKRPLFEYNNSTPF